MPLVKPWQADTSMGVMSYHAIPACCFTSGARGLTFTRAAHIQEARGVSSIKTIDTFNLATGYWAACVR